MIVSVNKENVEVPENSNIAKLVEQLHLPEHGTAIAIKSTVIPRTDWNNVQLNENDEIIVISAAYGG